MARFLSPQRMENISASNDTTQCNFCKSYLDYIERCLMNRTAAQVMYQVSVTCEFFYTAIEEPCRLAVDKNANIIYNGLKYHSDPARLCGIMTLCPQTSAARRQELSGDPWSRNCDFNPAMELLEL
ncbi:uncharacterized protein LOC119398748 [Rhipicephalus sanguineus]|uniref:uncharacterized protein LOC119398748 n=1 Tax=Rhipicephalus sanguineus TaxID=34632 RepID=UPI001894889E|nr:uncharacterized protein LOC119398748 [Rhipicephalus sanguineus]